VEKGGGIDADEFGENKVEPLGELLPARIAVGRKGDEILREADLPLAVRRDELVIVDRALRHHFPVHILRRKLFDVLLIAGIFSADGILKLERLLRLDLQNVGKPKLADHLDELVLFVNKARFVGKHNVCLAFKSFLISIAVFRENARRRSGFHSGAKRAILGSRQSNAAGGIPWIF